MKKSTEAILFFLLLFSFNSVYSINPDREYIRTPDSVKWNYQQLDINTRDGFRLNTWIYEAKPENDKDTVLILAYPDAGNMSYFVYHAAILANAGYTVVTFDYRGFGKSQDFEIQKEFLYYKEFAWDLEAVVETISKEIPNKKLGIWAMSMGTTIASRAYPQIKGQIDFIIGEGFVTDPDGIVDYYKEKGKEILLPESSDEFKISLESIDCPLLILTASNDKVTTHGSAIILQKKLGDNCEISRYEGEHLTGFQVDYDNLGFGGWFLSELEEFLQYKS
ncbi:alpha/beta fold hydrolase [Algoriphagus sp. NF]|jgi:pimeloyl-ACP methyl ester carboxylesterase|uniref:alpha/beta hydrolase n=1 Tax=unclassified Algoriphagus TaxID=2641541 RepID=UPI000C66A150|nr:MULTISPECIES: alpha/beta fold hydrolase [unclassified Algoriphagus]MAL13662.1 alpha/beta hydrolase [Algoriphagus sp.]MDE0561931.1 alpha/beta fold hydrolase [Algoriphagus sp. NF]HAD51954.1 alpha/beta hydrolase [Algoriphagus sp.]HAH37286.1 alpha/beta hydrolase [Algoriphagus sp.]HAS58352.1 alpha/beta hydrolase [Algoriphagus sp.]|tara:strand:+ start:1133 stop:1966 length:834 start_codon:yes stop_codon:yes gene_type:complete